MVSQGIAVRPPGISRKPGSGGLRGRSARATLGILCVGLGAIYLTPLVWVTSISVRSQQDVWRSILIPNSFQPGNFLVAWDRYFLALLLFNTLLVTVGVVVLATLLSTMAAYGFSRARSRWAEGAYLLILTGLMVPPAAMIIPFFLGMLKLGLYDSFVAVVIGETAFVLAFGVVVLRGYMNHIPDELIDAAQVDGAGEWQAFRHIVLPLIRPALGTVGLFFTIASWNAFLIPLILIRDTHNTMLSVGVSRFTGGFATVEYNVLGAAAVLAILPLLVVFMAGRRFYISGLSEGALKQ